MLIENGCPAVVIVSFDEQYTGATSASFLASTFMMIAFVSGQE
jgi:hypothetical protein